MLECSVPLKLDLGSCALDKEDIEKTHVASNTYFLQSWDFGHVRVVPEIVLHLFLLTLKNLKHLQSNIGEETSSVVGDV